MLLMMFLSDVDTSVMDKTICNVMHSTYTVHTHAVDDQRRNQFIVFVISSI